MTVKPEVEADAAPTPMKEGQCEFVRGPDYHPAPAGFGVKCLSWVEWVSSGR